MKKTFTSLLLLSFLASSLALYSFPGTAYAATTFTFVASSSGSGTTITIPGTPTAGDLCIIWNTATNSGGIPPDVTPAGFTKLATFASSEGWWERASVFAKKLDGTETTVTGLNGPNGTRWIAATFHPDSPFLSFANGMTPNGEWTNGNPASQTITSASAASLPAMLWGQMSLWSSVTISPRTTSPAMSEIAGAVGNHFAHYRVIAYGATPDDNTYDMDDEGNSNVLQSGYLTFTTAPPDAPTDLVTTSNTGSVGLSWTVPTDTGSSNLETYGVWRATSPFTETSEATLIASIATTSTSYSDSSAVHGTVYYYRATATNSTATSSLSNQKSSGSNNGRIIRLKGVRLR